MARRPSAVGFGIFDVLPLSWEYTHGSTGVLPYQLQKGVTTLPPGSFPTGAVGLAQTVDLSTVGVRLVEQHPHRNYALNWNLNIQHEIAVKLNGSDRLCGLTRCPLTVQHR